MKSVKVLVFSFFILLSTISAQTYTGYDYLYHYRNTQTPVETALGGMTSISTPSAYGHNLNPAFLAKVKSDQIETTYRLNNNAYLEKGKYRSVSINYNFDDAGMFGFTYMKYQYSDKIVADNIVSPTISREVAPNSDYYSISYAKETFEKFSIGLTYDFVRVDADFQDVKYMHGIDLGMLYTYGYKAFESDNFFTFGAEVDNLFRFGDILSDDLWFSDAKWYLFPQMVNISLSNEIVFPQRFNGVPLYSLNLQIAYSDEINTNEYSLFNFGAEITFAEILTLRYAYAEGNTEDRFPTYFDYTPKNTFGFGVKLPVGNWLSSGWPISVKFDYGHSWMRKIHSYGETSKLPFNSFSLGISLNT